MWIQSIDRQLFVWGTSCFKIQIKNKFSYVSWTSVCHSGINCHQSDLFRRHRLTQKRDACERPGRKLSLEDKVAHLGFLSHNFWEDHKDSTVKGCPMVWPFTKLWGKIMRWGYKRSIIRTKARHCGTIKWKIIKNIG